MEIAICDDNIIFRKKFLSKLETCISDQDHITLFHSGFELLSHHEIGYSFDLTFLDMLMPGMNGLAVAKEIRLKAPDAILVIVTDYDKYSIESHEYEPLRYLMKPVSKKKLQEVLERARQKLPLPEKIVLKTRTDTYYVPVREIAYIEIYRDRISVYTTTRREPYQCKGKLYHYVNLLDQRGFQLISRSALINTNRITNIKTRDRKVCIDTGYRTVQLDIAADRVRELEDAITRGVCYV